jgi:RNA polymerase sigma-70 factor (ECF subfamily)
VSLSPTERAPDAEQSRWFADEVHSHDGQLKAYLHGSFPSVRDIDDVVQESYLRIWRARLSYPIRSTKSFLFQIARHLAIDVVRSGRVVTTETLVDLEAQPVLEERPDAAAALSSKEKIGLLSEALASLPDRTREIIFLRKFQAIPQREVASRLGVSERTVEAQLAKGMKLCERFLRKRGVGGFFCDE